MIGRYSWKKLWKIYNQDISWHIKRKISITVLTFIWNLLISDFLWKPHPLVLLFDKEGPRVILLDLSNLLFLNIKH